MEYLKHIEALKHFECTFLNENVRISRKMAQKVIAKVRINTIPALIHIMPIMLGADQAASHYLNQ